MKYSRITLNPTSCLSDSHVSIPLGDLVVFLSSAKGKKESVDTEAADASAKVGTPYLVMLRGSQQFVPRTPVVRTV